MARFNRMTSAYLFKLYHLPIPAPHATALLWRNPWLLKSATKSILQRLLIRSSYRYFVGLCPSVATSSVPSEMTEKRAQAVIMKFGAVSLIDGEFTTLTTAVAVDTSARPTTLLRRIEVRKEDYEFNNTRDIFKRVELRFRRFGKEINDLWNWNHWCLLQPKTGNCGANDTKYYYNAQMNQCEPHKFTGCVTKGNKNQFDTIESCEHHCKGSCLMLTEKYPEDANICELQPITGRCVGYFELYYYDVNEGACKTFGYGGCAGNKNKFSVKEDCEAQCAHTARILTMTSDESTVEDTD